MPKTSAERSTPHGTAIIDMTHLISLTGMLFLVFIFGMPETPKDYKLEYVFYVEVTSQCPVLGNPEIVKVFEVFAANMHSVFSLGAAPPQFVGFTSLYRSVEYKAKHKLGMNPEDDMTPESWKESYAMLCEAVKSPDYQNMMHEWGTGNLKALLKFYPSVFNEAIEAILWAMVTGSWTAFEILTQDLFRCAEKANPAHFLAIKFNKGFKSRKRIRETYKEYFQNDPGISSVLDSHLWEGLALFRNVRVHKAGIADKEFIDGIALIPQEVNLPPRGIKNGDKIEINGELVRAPNCCLNKNWRETCKIRG